MGTVVEFPGQQGKISEWVCPLCRQELILSEFKSRREGSDLPRGFVLTCKGSDTVPHRLRIYLENFSKDASFLPGSNKSKKERAKQLLERLKVGA